MDLERVGFDLRANLSPMPFSIRVHRFRAFLQAPDKDLPLIKGKTEPVRDEESTKEQVGV